MKSIIVLGGLGNQMFFYALYVAMRLKGLKVKLDISFYNHVKMHNGYELDHIFNCPAKLVSKKGFHVWRLRLLMRLKPKYLLFVNHRKLDMQVFNTKCKYLLGYWQTEKYFEDYVDQLQQAFVFKDIDVINKSIAQNMQNSSSISLHMRFGDYVGWEECENICTINYYKEAINYIQNRVDNPVFYIFSNDIMKAEKIVKSMGISYEIIKNNYGIHSYKDMYLMSICKHNIISNSSFSWWGAWLNMNKDKIVIAPHIWSRLDGEDYNAIRVPKNWVRL